MSEETSLQELAEQALEPEGHHGSGPGFILGIVFGALAGAAAATLFAPPGPEDEAEGEAAEPRVEHEAGPFGATEHEPMQAPPSHLTTEAPAPVTATAPSEPEDPLERVRAMLARVRSRVDDARAEGRLAQSEEEAEMRARYERLTHGQEIRS